MANETPNNNAANRQEAGVPVSAAKKQADDKSKRAKGSAVVKSFKPAPVISREKQGRDNDSENDETVIGSVSFKRRKRANTGCLRGVLYFVLITAVSFGLAMFIWSCANDVLGLLKKDSYVTITIPENYTIPELSKALKKAGIIEHTWLFTIYCERTKAEKIIVPGTYEYVNTKHDYRALIHSFIPVKERKTVRVMIPEGVTLDNTLERLVNEGVYAKKDTAEEAMAEFYRSIEEDDYNYWFLEDAPDGKLRVEGFLYPDTYEFFTDESPRTSLRKMLNKFDQQLSPIMRQRIEDMPYSVYEIVTIASLIQAEAATIAEMKNIASVIYNRLEKWEVSYLGIDASLIYVMDGRRTITNEDKEMDNPYNLYKYQGLPPTPICSPSIEAIRAALYPSKTSYYYYALTDAGVHQFSKTKEEHAKVIANNPKTYGNGD